MPALIPNYTVVGGAGSATNGPLPGAVSIAKVEVIDVTGDATGQPMKLVTVTIVPPVTIGSFQGGWAYCDHPDSSIGSGTVDNGTQAADGTQAATGAFDPDEIKFFPYDPAILQFSFQLPAPRLNELWRVYFVSTSATTHQKPIQAGKPGASPSYQFLVTPPLPVSAGREWAPNVENASLATTLQPGWTANPNIEVGDSGDQHFQFDVTWQWPVTDQNIQSLGGINFILNDGISDIYIGNTGYNGNTGITEYVSLKYPVLPGTRAYTLYLRSYSVDDKNNTTVPRVTPSVSFTITRKLGPEGIEYTSLAISDGSHAFVDTAPFRSSSDGTALLRVNGYWSVPTISDPNVGTIIDPTFGGEEIVWLKTDGTYYTIGARGRLSPVSVDTPNPSAAQPAAFYLRSIDTNDRRNSIVPRISFTGGGGSGAVAFVTVTAGVITGFFLLNVGSGYSSAPTVVITGPGSGANLTVSVSGGAVTSPTIVAGGSGYVATPCVAATVGTSSGQLNLALADTAHFSAEFQVVGSVYKLGTVDAAVVKTGQLQVGGGGGKVSQVKIFDTLGSLIGWIGDDTGVSGYVGAWFKQLRIGGSSPGAAQAVADSAGNLTFSGTLVAGISITSPVISGGSLSITSGAIAVNIDATNKVKVSNSGATGAPYSQLSGDVVTVVATSNSSRSEMQSNAFVSVNNAGYLSVALGVSAGTPSGGGLLVVYKGDISSTVYFQVNANTAVSTTATAGAQTLPANPVGFLPVIIDGTARKFAYYAT